MKVLKKEDIFKISSKNKGPKICILGGVHGNESCGVEAIKGILNNPKFSINCGEITFIYANRSAIDKNVRFVEENLNRCFLKNKVKTNSYEENLAEDLKKLLDDCDVCLDLHASFSKESEPFIICEKNAYYYIKNFSIKKVCSSFDEYEPGGTDYYMNLIGKVGICVECGYLGDINSKMVSIQCIYSLLNILDMVKFKGREYKKEYLTLNKLYLAKNEFKLNKEFRDFEFLEKGELIGEDGNNRIRTEENGFILFAKDVKNNDVDKEAFLFGKKLTDYKKDLKNEDNRK